MSRRQSPWTEVLAMFTAFGWLGFFQLSLSLGYLGQNRLELFALSYLTLLIGTVLLNMMFRLVGLEWLVHQLFRKNPGFESDKRLIRKRLVREYPQKRKVFMTISLLGVIQSMVTLGVYAMMLRTIDAVVIVVLVTVFVYAMLIGLLPRLLGETLYGKLHVQYKKIGFLSQAHTPVHQSEHAFEIPMQTVYFPLQRSKQTLPNQLFTMRDQIAFEMTTENHRDGFRTHIMNRRDLSEEPLTLTFDKKAQLAEAVNGVGEKVLSSSTELLRHFTIQSNTGPYAFSVVKMLPKEVHVFQRKKCVCRIIETVHNKQKVQVIHSDQTGNQTKFLALVFMILFTQK